TGVVQTIVTGGGQTAVIDDGEELSLDDAIARYAREDLDLIVVEGFKAEPLPKIEVARAAVSTELLCLNDRNLVATVTDLAVRPAGSRPASARRRMTPCSSPPATCRSSPRTCGASSSDTSGRPTW